MTIAASTPVETKRSTPSKHGADSARRLTGTYRTTLNLLFKDPVSHHVSWGDVRDLFDHLGEARQVSNHRYELMLDHQGLTFLKPHTSHLSAAEMLELRGFLKSADWTPQSLSLDAAAGQASTQAGLVAIVVVSRHDAELYHFRAGSHEAAQTDTHQTFQVTDGGRAHLFDRIADATAHDERIIVMGRSDKDHPSFEDIARRLREHHPHATGRSVHEIATEDQHLDLASIRSLAAAALGVPDAQIQAK